AACGATDTFTYYEWTTIEDSAQDYDLFVRWRVPSNFDSSERLTDVTAYGWRTDATNNVVQVSIYNASGSQCGSTTQVAGNGSWSGTSVADMSSDSDCDVSAGDYITFRIRMNADSNDIVRLGQIEIGYKAVF